MYKVVLSWLGTVQLTNKRFKCLRNILLSFVTVSIWMENSLRAIFCSATNCAFSRIPCVEKTVHISKNWTRKKLSKFILRKNVKFRAKVCGICEHICAELLVFSQNCAFFCCKSLLPNETIILMYNQLKYALFGIKDQTTVGDY